MLPRGYWERELRNMGLGVIALTGFHPAGNIYRTEMRNVEIEQRPLEQEGRKFVTTTYHTAIGSISKKEDMNLSPPNPWILEYPIKSVSDYPVMEFILKNTAYLPNYEAFMWVDKHIGGDGIVRVNSGYSPFQNLLIKYIGYEGVAIHLHEYTKEFENILKVMEEKYFEIIHIIADSPAEIVGIDGNIDGRVTSPRLFERYLLPLYCKASEILHKKQKIVQVHMDGALQSLKDLIPNTCIDVVEAFTPPPVGNLSISEARSAWGKDMIIAANFPESVCLSGIDAIKKYTMELLKEVAPGDGFILSITEDIPYRYPNDILEQSLRAITEVLWEHGKYPLKL
ncbi:MAG: uroporphyrinogen decarboxylase family protein [Promethearchaeota archaeon]